MASGLTIVKRFFWSTLSLKTKSKYLIDPQTHQETSLTNNILMTTVYLNLKSDSSLPQSTAQQNMTVSVDKGANLLRTNPTGSQAQSVIQLEYQSGTLTLKEMRDMS